jgi:hypothetical protein
MSDKPYEEWTATERLRHFFAHGTGSYLSKPLAALHGKELEDALAAAREEGRREGFERARDRAAGRYERMAQQLRAESSETSSEKLRRERAELAEQWESEARIIRAMPDERAGEAPKSDSGGRICDCTGAPHRREDGCP